jgi:hypothetical protein
MKRLITLALAFIIGSTTLLVVDTAQAGTCGKKRVAHHKKHYKHYCTRTMYVPGYCVDRQCGRCTQEFCYPAYTLRCHTEYYYHHGRNMARVEVCD